jgi:hypothetical protein
VDAHAAPPAWSVDLIELVSSAQEVHCMAGEMGGLSTELLKGALGALGAAWMVWFMGWWSPFLSFAHQALESLWMHLIAQSQWPNWSAYLVSVWLLISIVRLAVRKFESRNDNHNRFKKFSFGGSVWRWNSMSSLPYGLRPYCPRCDSMLVYEETGGGYSGDRRQVLLHCER